jgi:hypothetical protein
MFFFLEKCRNQKGFNCKVHKENLTNKKGFCLAILPVAPKNRAIAC